MANALSIYEYISKIPKAELHLHIEGTLEPDLIFKIAERNKIKLKYNSVDALKKAYNFNNLQEFLNIYYAGANVLLTAQDFYDMTWAYLSRAHEQNIVHTEIFFDPQTHTNRKINFETVITGIYNAISDAKIKLGISCKLILSILRDLSVESAMTTLEESVRFRDWITAIGLDSAENGNPPSKFKTVFAKARDIGFLTVAHAGEEGPPEYVWDAINNLSVSRIDHGNRSLEDDLLVDKLKTLKMPLTVCPLSNLKLKVINDLKNHPLKLMLDKGLLATVNSDDPAYFGGYLNENFDAVTKALNLSKNDIFTLVKNSFNASFLSEQEKEAYLSHLEMQFSV